MPEDFTTCIAKKNSKKITKTLPNGKYIHLCKDEKGWHQGEVKTKQKPTMSAG